MNKSTMLKPLKTVSQWGETHPLPFTMDPAQFGLFEACSVPVTVPDPPETLGSDKQAAGRTGGQWHQAEDFAFAWSFDIKGWSKN